MHLQICITFQSINVQYFHLSSQKVVIIQGQLFILWAKMLLQGWYIFVNPGACTIFVLSCAHISHTHPYCCLLLLELPGDCSVITIQENDHWGEENRDILPPVCSTLSWYVPFGPRHDQVTGARGWHFTDTRCRFWKCMFLLNAMACQEGVHADNTDESTLEASTSWFFNWKKRAVAHHRNVPPIFYKK